MRLLNTLENSMPPIDDTRTVTGYSIRLLIDEANDVAIDKVVSPNKIYNSNL